MSLRRALKPRRVLVAIGWAVVILVSVYFIQRDASRYIDYSPEGYRHHWDLRWWLIPHIVCAGLALLAGPLQFSTWLRARYPRLHRLLGKVYVVGGLIAAPAAFRLALGSKCAPCVMPLAILSALWFITTAIAFWAARQRAFRLHREFMIRSYVLMCAFVVIRLTEFSPFSMDIADAATSRSVYEWLCWVVPLLITEIWLSWAPGIRKALARAP